MAVIDVDVSRADVVAAIRASRTEAVVLERAGIPVAVLVSPERHEELLTALEDLRDIDAFDAAMDEDGPDVPWAQVEVHLAQS